MEQNNISREKITVFLNQVDSIDKIELIFNKYISEKKILLTDEILEFKNSIFHYIEFDQQLSCSDLTLEILTRNSRFSSSIGKLVNKLIAEENI